ncbi:hypothetical protein JCM11251_006160 [Rhodosporidiobolus azoricus]
MVSSPPSNRSAGAASAPSSSPSRHLPSAHNVAAWPASVLLDIFLYAADIAPGDSRAWVEERQEHRQGGSLCAFLSHGVLTTSALYRSIVVSSPGSANSLLETLIENPDYCGKVKRLALGLSDPLEISRLSNDDLLASSRTCTHILSLCYNLDILQLRPLHQDLAPDLLAALRPLGKTLRCLVIGPDGRSQHDTVLRSFTSDSVEAIVRVMPRLETLEVNCWAAPKGGEAARWDGPGSGEAGRPLALKQLGINAEMDREVFEGLLSECEGLEVLDIYMEREIRLDETRQALRASTSTMQNLRFFINTTPGSPPTHVPNGIPPATLFNEDLLPFYTSLAGLHLCNNLSSPSIFRHLPLSRSLRHLSLHSLAPALPGSDHFRFTPSLLDDLEDPHKTPYVDALETVRIRDVQSAWGKGNVLAVRRALARRGVELVWEEDRDSASGSGGSGASGNASGRGAGTGTGTATGTGTGTGTGSDETGSARGGSTRGQQQALSSSDPVQPPHPLPAFARADSRGGPARTAADGTSSPDHEEERGTGRPHWSEQGSSPSVRGRRPTWDGGGVPSR